MDAELQAALAAVQREVSGLRQEVQAQRSETDAAVRATTRLVNELSQQDDLRERAERAEERTRQRQEEADDALDSRRHQSLLDALDTQTTALKALTATTERVGAALRDLPATIVRVVEKEIYKLRRVRHEVKETTGVVTEPGTLQNPPYREPTGKYAVPVAPPAPPEDMALTPAQQRGLLGAAKKVWLYKFHIGGGGFTLYEIGHYIYEWARHLGH